MKTIKTEEKAKFLVSNKNPFNLLRATSNYQKSV